MEAIAKFAKNLLNREKSRPSEVVTDLSPMIQVLRDGTVKRLGEPPYAPPSLTGDLKKTKVFSRDVTISASLKARIYLPNHLDYWAGKLPIFVYYHGGGFCLDSAFSARSHGYMNELVNEAQVIAVSIDYRRAPENHFPVAFDDSLEALEWVASHVVDQQNEYHPSPIHKSRPVPESGPHVENCNSSPREDWLVEHGDFSRLFIGGDCAGATIAHYLSSKVMPGQNGLAGGAVTIVGTILCFPFFCDENTDKNSTLYKMWDLAYPNCPNGTDNEYINPFPKSPRRYPFQLQRMFVCYGEEDECRDITARFVEAMREKKRFGLKGSNSSNLAPVTDYCLVGDGKRCFHIFDPTSARARNLIQDIKKFIHGHV